MITIATDLNPKMHVYLSDPTERCQCVRYDVVRALGRSLPLPA